MIIRLRRIIKACRERRESNLRITCTLMKRRRIRILRHSTSVHFTGNRRDSTNETVSPYIDFQTKMQMISMLQMLANQIHISPKEQGQLLKWLRVIRTYLKQFKVRNPLNNLIGTNSIQIKNH